jgi:hypothetical protein
MQSIVRTARTTGFLYLGLAITGLLGFLVIRGQLFVAGDPEATLANLMDQEALARVGVTLEMGVVVTQALAAVWFFRLFRSADSFAAGCLAAFGLVNAVVILGSAVFLGTAIQVAADPGLAPGGDAAATVQLLYVLSGGLWEVGGLFFGLWLVPMGWLVLRSGWLPRPLGWILIGGGAGYVLGAFLGQLVPDAGAVVDALALPASVGEVWMVGYLLLRGVRPRAWEADGPVRSRAVAATRAAPPGQYS